MFDSITQPQLQVSPALYCKALTLCQIPSQTFSVKYRLYLNQVCLETILPWITDYAANARLIHQNWQRVNGSTLLFNQKNLVLLPQDTIDTNELIVPQYWTEGDHTGDYFLSVYFEPDELWLQIDGYTTLKTLKTHGHYDPHEQSYSLDRLQMIQDVAILGVTQELCPNEETR